MYASALDPLHDALVLAETHTALGLDREAFVTYGEVVDALLEEDRAKDALLLVDKMIALDPYDPAGQLKKATCHQQLGDIDATVASAGRAVPLYLQCGRIDEALELLERIISYWPDPACALAAARIHIDRGGPHEGLAALRKLQICFKANPEDLDIMVLLARAFDAIGQPEKADRVLEEAARVAERSGDETTFERLVELLLSRAPSSARARELNAKVQRKRSQARAFPAKVNPLDTGMLWLEDEITDALMRRPASSGPPPPPPPRRAPLRAVPASSGPPPPPRRAPMRSDIAPVSSRPRAALCPLVTRRRGAAHAVTK